MASLFDESTCQPGDFICDMRNEVLNVLLEACIVFVAVGVSTKFWRRSLRKKPAPGKCVSSAGRRPNKWTPSGGQPSDRNIPNVGHSGRSVESTSPLVGPGGAATLMKYHLLFRGYAANRDAEGIVRTLKVMTQQGIHPDDASFDAALGRFPTNFSSSAASILCVFEALVHAGFKPSKITLHTVLTLLAETDSWESTLHFLRFAPGRFGLPAEAVHYAKLGRTCKKAGNLAAAASVHEAMVADIGEVAVDRGVASWRSRDLINEAAPACTKVGALRTEPDTETLQLRKLCAQFVVANRLDKVHLEKLPKEQFRWIMDEDFLLQGGGGTCSAGEVLRKLERVAAQKPAEFWKSYPTPTDSRNRLSRFIALNGLDSRCSEMLWDLPVALARQVMDHEFFVKVDPARGTANAKVVGNVLRYRRLSMGEQA